LKATESQPRRDADEWKGQALQAHCAYWLHVGGDFGTHDPRILPRTQDPFGKLVNKASVGITIDETAISEAHGD